MSGPRADHPRGTLNVCVPAHLYKPEDILHDHWGTLANMRPAGNFGMIPSIGSGR